MKKSLFLCFFLLLYTTTSLAQSSDTDYVVQVMVESAYIRTLPDKESPAVSSIFQNQSLMAVGRNIDGQWIEVRRPVNPEAIGWIARDLVVLTFEVARLPITDSVTGLVGPVPVTDTGYAVLTIGTVALRTAPERGGQILEDIPVYFTLPVMERTPNLQWLKVNYRGTVGWVSQFLTSTRSDLLQVPISPEYAADGRYAAPAYITPEQQLAQIDRLTEFIVPIDQMAAEVARYWRLLSEGETLECRPPAGNYGYYGYSAQDIIELPELRQQVRRLQQAVDDINTAIEAMQPCGIYTQSQIRQAYSKALNAQLLFRLVNQSMGNTRRRILPPSRQTTLTG